MKPSQQSCQGMLALNCIGSEVVCEGINEPAPRSVGSSWRVAMITGTASADDDKQLSVHPDSAVIAQKHTSPLLSLKDAQLKTLYTWPACSGCLVLGRTGNCNSQWKQTRYHCGSKACVRLTLYGEVHKRGGHVSDSDPDALLWGAVGHPAPVQQCFLRSHGLVRTCSSVRALSNNTRHGESNRVGHMPSLHGSTLSSD